MVKKKRQSARLGPVENAVMQIVWDRGEVTADEVRIALAGKHDLKDSTIRTVLRRLEEKYLLTHRVDGRTFVYSPAVEPEHLANDAVRGIAEKFCSGSIANLLMGMANDRLVTPQELRDLARKIEKAKKQDT